MKKYNSKDLATELANVLKYNPELIKDPGRFDDLVVALEVRFMMAYNSGLDDGKKVELISEEDLQPVKSTSVIPPSPPAIPSIPFNN